MSKKIIVAKTGYSALTETDPDNLRFSSDYNTLKYYASGSTSIRIVGDGSDQTTEASLSHGLGYVPYFVVFVSIPNWGDDYGYAPFRENTLAINVNVNGFATSSHLYFRFQNHSNNDYTAYFYYKIYKNKTNL